MIDPLFALSISLIAFGLGIVAGMVICGLEITDLRRQVRLFSEMAVKDGVERANIELRATYALEAHDRVIKAHDRLAALLAEKEVA